MRIRAIRGGVKGGITGSGGGFLYKIQPAGLETRQGRRYSEGMEWDYTYFEADEGGYVGYFTDFPQHVTEGETIEELEEMLFDMYECLNLAKYRKRKLAIA